MRGHKVSKSHISDLILHAVPGYFFVEENLLGRFWDILIHKLQIVDWHSIGRRIVTIKMTIVYRVQFQYQNYSNAPNAICLASGYALGLGHAAG